MMPLVCGKWARQMAAYLGCCLLFPALAAPASADEGSLPAQRQVTVGVAQSFPPYSLWDEDGNPSGFAVEAMNEVAKRAGFKAPCRVAENGAANAGGRPRRQARDRG